MTPVVVGMAVCVIAALLVLALVAVPRVRGGEKLLTPDGEQTVRDASRRARTLAAQARGRAGEVASDVREKTEEVRKRRAAQAQAHQAEAHQAEAHQAEAAQSDEAQPQAVETDAWSAPAAVRPAAPARKREPGAGTRTATLTAPVAVSPAEDAAETPAATEPQVIDLRDPDSRRAPPPAARAAGQSAPTRRHRQHRDADLGWGEPRPGPRHSR